MFSVIANVHTDASTRWRSADRDLILCLEQARKIGVFVRENARRLCSMSDDIGLLAIAVFIAEKI